MFLTPDELAELTGYRQPARQLRFLRRAGWAVEVDAHGLPIVSRAYCQQRMSAGQAAANDHVVNIAALRAARRRA